MGMGIGAAQERWERMMLLDREMHVAWVTANAWKQPMAPARRWRQYIARLLVALAARIAPTVTAQNMNMQATNQ
jgi:hypothetical protein